MTRAGRSAFSVLRYSFQRTPQLLLAIWIALLPSVVFALVVVFPWGSDKVAVAETSSAVSVLEPPESPGLAYDRVSEVVPLPPAAQLIMVQPEKWDAASKSSLQEALDLLPEGVRAQLGNPDLGPMFILINTEGMTLSGRQPYGRAANFYSTNEGRNEVVLYPGQSARTALHELGHAYNLRNVEPGAYAQVYLEPEMQSFMSITGWRVTTPPEALAGLRDHTRVDIVYGGSNIWTSLSRNDPLEDFANSFALYFMAPQELEALSPARYGWFAERFDK